CDRDPFGPTLRSAKNLVGRPPREIPDPNGPVSARRRQSFAIREKNDVTDEAGVPRPHEALLSGLRIPAADLVINRPDQQVTFRGERETEDAKARRILGDCPNKGARLRSRGAERPEGGGRQAGTHR